VLVVDAFSSDAVPMHLLTKEVFDIYGRHLKPNGLLLVHVSNRHLNLAADDEEDAFVDRRPCVASVGVSIARSRRTSI
jgi:spermidine synthase